MSVPIVEAERRREPTRRRSKRRKGRWRARWLRRLVFALLILALMPLALTLVYYPRWVHPISTLMLADAVTLRGYDRQWVRLDEVGNNLVYAVMMSEDGQFCAHDGVDWAAVSTVLEGVFSGERPRGASTIPMQTVKNLFLWPGRSFLRKAIETPLAIYFDAVMPKRRIMEIYLNIVEWGPGIYGAEAAAQYYFNTSARNLSARQAALLAVALPHPILRNPVRPTQGLNRLANIIQRRASKAGAYVSCLR